MINGSVRVGDPFAHAGDERNGGRPPAPPGPTPTTREQRGLALFWERAGQITHVRGSAWSVPSCTRAGVYLVDLAGGICTCGDRPPAGEVCKHAAAATVAHAKSGGCSGCGKRFPRRELLELVEGEHDGLTFFDGDLLCGGCARAHGVL